MQDCSFALIVCLSSIRMKDRKHFGKLRSQTSWVLFKGSFVAYRKSYFCWKINIISFLPYIPSLRLSFSICQVETTICHLYFSESSGGSKREWMLRSFVRHISKIGFYIFGWNKVQAYCTRQWFSSLLSLTWSFCFQCLHITQESQGGVGTQGIEKPEFLTQCPTGGRAYVGSLAGL